MMVKTVDSVQKKPVTEVDRLMAVYQKEPWLHRRILQIMALLYTTESKMDFFNGLFRAQFRGVDKKLLGLSNFNFILNHLKRKQLLTPHYHCHPMMVQPLTREVLSQDPIVHDHLSLLQQGFGYQEQYEFSSFTSLGNYRVIHIAAHLKTTVALGTRMRPVSLAIRACIHEDGSNRVTPRTLKLYHKGESNDKKFCRQGKSAFSVAIKVNDQYYVKEFKNDLTGCRGLLEWLK